MNLIFEPMSLEHGKEVMDIFNYYIANSFAAYPDTQLPYEFFGGMLEMTRNYPAYVIKNDNADKVLGFCFLHAYHPFPVFKETAEVSYFIAKEEVGRGIGKAALARLEEDARRMGIRRLLAGISSENSQSIGFHGKNGFRECGRFHQVGMKMGRYFDQIWMEKELY